MNGCEQYRELISRLMDGDLSPDEEKALKAHIENCEDCRKLYAAFASLSSALSGELEEPPEDMKANIMAAVGTPVLKPVARISHWKTWLAAAACLALVLAGAAGSGLFSRSGSAASLSAVSTFTDSAADTVPPSETAAAESLAPQADGDAAFTAEKAAAPAQDSPAAQSSALPSSAPDSIRSYTDNSAAAVKTSAGDAATVTGPGGSFTVTDSATQDKLSALLAKQDTASGAAQVPSSYDAPEASPDGGYTVTLADGRTLTVRVSGERLYCTDASTGEEYLAAGSASDFTALTGGLAAGS